MRSASSTRLPSAVCNPPPLLFPEPSAPPLTCRRPRLFMWPLILLILACCALPARAEESMTAAKECSSHTSPCESVTEASFSIATSQIIRWEAQYHTPVSDTSWGHSFFLSTVASNLADIPLTTSGELGGEHFLSPGTYHISIRNAAMGPGSYTVFFNRHTAISVSPASHTHDFGLTTAGTTASPPAFT